MQIVAILIPLALPGAYDYAVPQGMTVGEGDIVRVPLGPRRVYGVVWGPGSGTTAAQKIKPIAERLDVPPLAEELRQFVDWVAAYVMAPPGAVLRQVMRVPAAFEPAKPLIALRVAGTRPARLTPARQRVFAALADTHGQSQGGLTAADLAREAAVSASVVKSLLADGHLSGYELPGHKPFWNPTPSMRSASLPPSKKASPPPCATRSGPTPLPPICSTGSPVRAKPKFILKRLRKPCGAASGPWCCCRKSR